MNLKLKLLNKLKVPFTVKPETPKQVKVPFTLKTKKNNKPQDCNKRNPAPPWTRNHERKRPNRFNMLLQKVKIQKKKKNNVKPTQPKPEVKQPKPEVKSNKVKFTIKQKPKTPPKTSTQKCTTRNPAPPCAEGFEEKTRPNGEVCCYKSNR